MTDHDRLFDTVLSAPDDDTPRLVYADFLEEQGGVRNSITAKFIRLSCELARTPAEHPDRPRMAELARQYVARCQQWLLEDPVVGPGHRGGWLHIEFDRGVPVLTWNERWFSFARKKPMTLARVPPGCGVRIAPQSVKGFPGRLVRWLARLADWPDTRRVVGWAVHGPYPRSDEDRAAFGAAFRRVLDGVLFPHLRAVEFHCGRGLTDADLAAVAAAPLPALRRLALDLDGLTAAGVAGLLAGGHGEWLDELKLVHDNTDGRDVLLDLAARLGAAKVTDWGHGRGAFDVPRPGRPPLHLILDDDIPF